MCIRGSLEGWNFSWHGYYRPTVVSVNSVTIFLDYQPVRSRQKVTGTCCSTEKLCLIQLIGKAREFYATFLSTNLNPDLLRRFTFGINQWDTNRCRNSKRSKLGNLNCSFVPFLQRYGYISPMKEGETFEYDRATTIRAIILIKKQSRLKLS